MKYNEKSIYEIDDNSSIINESLLYLLNETTNSNLTKNKIIIPEKDNNTFNKIINSGIFQGIKNKSFIETNLSVYEKNFDLKNNNNNKNTKEIQKHKLFFFFLIVFLLVIIGLSIIIFKDLFYSTLRRKGIYDIEERNSLNINKKYSSKKKEEKKLNFIKIND